MAKSTVYGFPSGAPAGTPLSMYDKRVPWSSTGIEAMVAARIKMHA